jgi:phage shock protein A
MNLLERKRNVEQNLEAHIQELKRLDAFRERIRAEMNALAGQARILDELIAEAEAEVPPPEPPETSTEEPMPES